MQPIGLVENVFLVRLIATWRRLFCIVVSGVMTASTMELFAQPISASPQPVFFYDSITVPASDGVLKRASALDWITARALPLEGAVAGIASDRLVDSAPGDRFSIAALDRTAKEFVTERVWTSANGGRTWVGRCEDGSVVRRAYVSEFEGRVTGHVDLGETELDIVPVTGDAQRGVYVIDMQRANATRALSAQADYRIPAPLDQQPQSLQEETRAWRALAEQAARAKGPELKAAPTPQTTIDVLVAFTDGMVTRYGSVAGAQSRINTLFAFANTAYVNSDVAITLRLVGAQQVSYGDTSPDHDVALYEITGSNGGSSISIPPVLSSIAGLRNTYGADLVAFVRSYNASVSGCGVAWVSGFNVTDVSNSQAFGYAVIADGSYQDGVFTYFCPLTSFAHELGHNMGLSHDRPNAGSGFGATPYAYGYSLPSNTLVGDLMSYAEDNAQAFSSPDVRCSTGATCAVTQSGAPLGVAADGPIEACINTSAGCAPALAAQCTANPSSCADAARALNFTRVKVSNFRPTVAVSLTISGTASVVDGTALCVSSQSGGTANCGAVSAGAYSCAVPSGWTGTLHLQAGNANRVAARRYAAAVTTSQSAQNFNVFGANTYGCNLDVDNNGLNEAAIDGVMMLRRILGINGTAQTVPASSVCAQRTSATDMAAYLSAQNYNFDGGTLSAQREGLVMLRLMLGVAGTDAVAGTSLSWPTVRTQINTACGTSF
jgi:Metallo-peptidase family M12B Reprolysin-like